MRADFVLDHAELHVNQPQKVNLMARFVSGPAPADQERRPLNISLVIDRSGSMAGDKIDYTRQASQFLVQNLGMQDILSIVLYNDTVETLLMPEPVQRKDVIAQRIGKIKAGGTTNLSSGWLEGCNLVAQNLDDNYVNRVILMSDGLANRGVTDNQRLVEMATQKFQGKISTTTMGLGNDFNEDLLMSMATAGGGNFYFIESPEVTPLIFQEELQGLLNVVGQNLVVTLEPSPHVQIINQLHAYPMHTDGRNTSYRMGDVFGDEVKALLLELSIPALSDVGEEQIANLRFEYDELRDKKADHHVIDMPVMVNVRAPDGQPLLTNPEVEQSVLLLRAAQSRKRAIKAADRGDFSGASQILRDAAAAIEQSPATDARLLEERNALIQQADEVEQGSARYNVYSRKTMSTQAFYTLNSRHDDTMMLRGREKERIANQSLEAQAAAPSFTVEPREGVTPTHMTWNDKTYQLAGDIIRIGRSKHNEITILASGISRFHCHLRRDGDNLLLEDLGSTNGTVVAGVVLESPHILNVGDVAYLCDEKLIFHDGQSANNE